MMGMVAEIDQQIVGYVNYDLMPTSIQVLNLAVASTHRRQRIGQQILAKLTAKLDCNHRQQILANVWERNVGAQKFFRACGWQCRSILRNEFGVGDVLDEDAYQFVLRADEVMSGNQTRRFSSVGSTETT